jgi:UDP-N-acetylmuramoylalanine--D-glutamate ligase
LAIAGTATARALLRRGYEVIALDDDVTPERLDSAEHLGIELRRVPADDDLTGLVSSCELLSPAPGVPEAHAVIATAQRLGVPVLSEIELAYRWEQERRGGPRPLLAITGTDGKTTTTLLTVAMLRAGGLRSVDAGNTETPLVDAIEQDLDAFVVECTSFRLAWTPSFRADGAAWLNLAPDHLNWHRSMDSYERAKARIFANQTPSDVAVGFVDDPAVMRHLAAAPGRRRTFGLTRGDYRTEHRALVGPDGPIAPVDAMRRGLPHDITNALAASALVLETGLAREAAVEEALRTFRGPPHRLEEVGRWSGIAWYNDSKATTPHAAAAAVRAFDQVVLIAGGYDKGVDLTPMSVDRHRVRILISIGDTAPAVEAAFGGVPETYRAGCLDEAVDLSRRHARSGDSVLLSPGCASFDQYTSFEARGEHFRRLVLEAHTDHQNHRENQTHTDHQRGMS